MLWLMKYPFFSRLRENTYELELHLYSIQIRYKVMRLSINLP